MTLSDKNNRLKQSAVFAGVFVAILLALLKFFAFLKTDSLAIFSSFVDSVTDLFASLVTMVAVYFSAKPANITHRYGYGKTEALSALLQACFVGVSGLFVIIDGIRRFISPIQIEQTSLGLLIMIFSILATLLLVVYQTYVANRTDSLAIKADRAHYTIDFLTNAAVILSLLFVHFFGFVYFDILAALFISFYLLYNAYNLSVEAIEMITDKELSPEIRKNIEKIALNSQGILGLHDVRTRNLGGIYYFELHLEIDGNLSLFKAHQLTDKVEQNILQLYPNSQILIHQDPYGLKEDRLDHQIEGSCKIV